MESPQRRRWWWFRGALALYLGWVFALGTMGVLSARSPDSPVAESPPVEVETPLD